LQEQENEALKKQRRKHWFKRVTRKTVFLGQTLLAIGALLLGVATRIPWLNEIIKKIGLNDPTAIMQTLTVVVIVSVFFELRSLTERDDPSAGQRRYFADPMDVYPVLMERIRSIKRQDQKTLDILGMTLYTAWPSIRFWLNRPDLASWTVRLAAVAHRERHLSNHVPQSWFRDSKANLDSVLENMQSSAIRANNIKLEPYGYDFMPSLHGYRLGNGDLFYSMLLWQPDGKLGFDGYSYEFVPAEDRSPAAEAKREVFDAWFMRAKKSPWTGAQIST